jgi:hypothetical protein
MLFNRMVFLQSSAVELTGSYLGREDREEERGGEGRKGGGGGRGAVERRREDTRTVKE